MHDFIPFLIGNLILCLITGMFFGIRRLFDHALSAGSRYRFWYFYIGFLLLPFLPLKITWLPSRLFGDFLHSPSKEGILDALTHAAAPATEGLADAAWMQDFYIASKPQFLNTLPTLLFILWILGMCCFAAAALYLFVRTKICLLHATAVTRDTFPELAAVFSHCKKEKHMTCPVRVFLSDHVTSPICLGLFMPKILLPRSMAEPMDPKQLRYIFLHELQHCKQKDGFMNLLICLLRIPYWFNPAVLFACKKIQTDREIACDHAVIRPLPPKERLAYGHTILTYADPNRLRSAASHASTLGAGASQLKQRIVHIAASCDASICPPKKRGTLLAVILMCILLFVSGPFLCVQAHDISGDTAVSLDMPQKTTKLDLSGYFSGYEGAFVLCDMDNETYTVYNEAESRKRFSPTSTYKILSALLALDAQVITPSDTQKTWDGSAQPFDSWESDQTLTSAMQASVNWYFKELDQQTGADRISAGFQKARYGNADISSGLSDYWLDGSLQISPLEQIQFLHGFYTNEWGFQSQDIDAVKKALFLKERNGCRLYGKTGTQANGENLTGGWFVGFLETGSHTYSFAIHLTGKDHAGGSAAAQITLDIFEDLGLF